MMSPTSKAHIKRIDDESGAILLLMIFLSVTLLALAGLAIDSANLYRGRLVLQKAVDAGSVSGLRERAKVGYPESLIVSTGTYADQRQTRLAAIVTTAYQMVRANLKQHNIESELAADPDQPEVCTDQTKACVAIKFYLFSEGLPNSAGTGPEDDKIRVSILYRQPLLLMHAVPFDILQARMTPRDTAIRVEATGVPQRVNVTLALDVSNSMGCSADNPDCSCLTAPGGCLNQKINFLKPAALEFIGHYNQNRDRISFVPFATISNPATFPFDPTGAVGFDTDSALVAINNLLPAGATNICDAIMSDYYNRGTINQTKPHSVIQTDREINELVIFSDGAPTSACYCYPGIANCTTTTSTAAACTVSLTWRPNAVAVGANAAAGTVGPSPLFKRASAQAPPGTSTVATLLSANSQQCAPPVGTQNVTPQQAADATYMLFCLPQLQSPVSPSLEFLLPAPNYLNGRWNPDSFTSVNGLPLSEPDRWRQQMHHCAVAWADALRYRGVTVSAIGIGQPPGIGTQDLLETFPANTFVRNDHFLARLTADTAWMANAPRLGWPNGHPPYLFDPTREMNIDYGYGRPPLNAANGIRTNGVYIAASDVTNLRMMFEYIAQRIGSKLVR